jgi:hypothetical protein
MDVGPRMVFFSVGLPSRFAEWCDALILALVERQLGSAQAVALNGLDELATAFIRTPAVNVVACCRHPVPRLQAEILQAQRPFLVALGDPRAALQYLSARAGYSMADAARAVASSCAAMAAISTARHALVLTPTDAADPRALIQAVLQHYHIRYDPADVRAVLAALPDAGFKLDEAEFRTWEAQLADRDRAIIDGAVAPYISCFSGRELEQLVWEPDLFYMNEDPPAPTLKPVTRPIELTGRVRFVVYGPFITIPAGAWTATVVIAFSAEAAEMGFVLEVFAGRPLASARIEVTGAQVYETRLPFTIGDDLDHPIQIRICNERAAFDGRLAVGYVALRRDPSLPQQERKRLQDALRG